MVQHLKQLSASGVTHIELLPVFDLATVNEFSDKVADIQQPFSRPVRDQQRGEEQRVRGLLRQRFDGRRGC